MREFFVCIALSLLHGVSGIFSDGDVAHFESLKQTVFLATALIISAMLTKK